MPRHPCLALLAGALTCCLFSAVFAGSALATEQTGQKEPFTRWLEEYRAWDVLQNELSREEATPENVLKRSRLLLRLNRPDQARDLLERVGAFPDAELEARRIWLQARALRMQQSTVQALLQFSRAAAAMDEDSRVQTMRSEPELEWFWKAVWKQCYWDHFTGLVLLANQGQQRLMLQAAEQGGLAWPEDPFWTQAADIMRASLERSAQDTPADEASAGSQSPMLSLDPESIQGLATSLAAATVGREREAKRALQGLPSQELRLLWQECLTRLYGRTFQAEAGASTGRLLKETAFRSWVLPSMDRLPKQAWRIREPEAPSWQAFRRELAGLPPAEALTRLEKERESTLLGAEIKRGLTQYALVYALLAERYGEVRAIWSRLDPEELPLSLKLCGLLLGYEREVAESLRGKDKAAERRVLAMLTEMLGPGEFWASHLVASFWIEAPGGEEEPGSPDLGRKFPLDRLLSYSLDSRAWEREPSQRLAKRAALLYPGSRLRNQGLFFLAKRVHEQGQARLAWRYVQRMDPDLLDAQGRAEFLMAKAGLLMEMGRESESLEAYKQVLEVAPDKLPLEKRLKLAVMAQRQGRWDWAQSMLQELWSKRESMPSSLQAEVMFWLAEGAQKTGNRSKALEHYLKLAWEHPEEHIWAVTALYRSALIYEKQGRLQAAHRLLEEVTRRADRESQKRAAEDRIEALERKMDQGVPSAPDLQYLF